jgi:hypothetical protein
MGKEAGGMIPPSTFAESERRYFGRWMVGAGVCYGIAAIAAASLIVWGNWPPELAKLRLIALWSAMGGAILGSIAVTIAMAVGGPVGRFSVTAGKDGATLEAEGDSQ